MRNDLDLERIIEDVAPALYRYFCASFSSNTCEDLVQETLIRFVAKINEGKFNPELGNHRMYAFGIARFVRLENRNDRHLTSIIENEPVSEASSVDEDIERNQSLQHLRDAMAQLAEAEQEVLGLYLDEELSYEEMGHILNMPLGTIKSHIHRAKQNLKELLAKKGDKYERP